MNSNPKNPEGVLETDQSQNDTEKMSVHPEVLQSSRVQPY